MNFALSARSSRTSAAAYSVKTANRELLMLPGVVLYFARLKDSRAYAVVQTQLH